MKKSLSELSEREDEFNADSKEEDEEIASVGGGILRFFRLFSLKAW
jgi:hypothetical protein